MFEFFDWTWYGDSGKYLTLVYQNSWLLQICVTLSESSYGDSVHYRFDAGVFAEEGVCTEFVQNISSESIRYTKTNTYLSREATAPRRRLLVMFS